MIAEEFWPEAEALFSHDTTRSLKTDYHHPIAYIFGVCVLATQERPHDDLLLALLLARKANVADGFRLKIVSAVDAPDGLWHVTSAPGRAINFDAQRGVYKVNSAHVMTSAVPGHELQQTTLELAVHGPEIRSFVGANMLHAEVSVYNEQSCTWS